jgi:hypothetical protein
MRQYNLMRLMNFVRQSANTACSIVRCVAQSKPDVIQHRGAASDAPTSLGASAHLRGIVWKIRDARMGALHCLGQGLTQIGN